MSSTQREGKENKLIKEKKRKRKMNPKQIKNESINDKERELGDVSRAGDLYPLEANGKYPPPTPPFANCELG